MLERVGEKWVHFSAVFIVGWRQVRDVWKLLLVAGSGIMLAVMLTIMLPNYAYLTLQARLHRITDTGNPTVTISVDLPPTVLGSSNSGTSYAVLDQELRSLVHQQLGAYLQPQSWHAIQTSSFDLHSQDTFGAPQQLIMVATTLADLGSHAHFVKGRMPQDVPIAATPMAAPLLEGALPADAAAALHVTVGSILSIPYQAGVGFGPQSQQPPLRIPLMRVRITGIFSTPVPSANPFFHVFDFKTFRSGGTPTPVTYSLLVPQQSFLAAAESVGFNELPSPLSLFWFYQPNLSTFTLDNFDDIANRLATINGIINQVLASSAEYLFLVGGSLIGSDSAFQVYHAEVAVARTPITILLIDIVGLLIFFVSLIAEQLVESQSGVIALFRARGLSRVQLFGAYVVQSLSLAVVSLVLGLVGTFVAERLLMPRLLSQGSYHPSLTLEQGIVRWLLFALLVAGSALVTMWLATAVALQGDVLSARREASRSTRKPIWQRFHLDLALALSLLVTYGLTNFALATVTDPQTVAQLAPLSVVAPTLLVVAGVLILLRVLPSLFRLGTQLVTRSRTLVPFLPLAQLARTPQYMLRMVLLFALIVAFAVYVFIFSASQESRVADLAAQQVGADITGLIPSNLTTNFPDEQARYQAISGVASASLGYIDEGTPITASGGTLVSMLAIDTDTYVHTAIWPGQSGDTTVPLLSKLSADRGRALAGDYVPALVNASTWNTLHLSQGATFHLVLTPYTNSSMKLIAVAEVPSIPSLDPTQPAILVDFQAYGEVLHTDTNSPVPTPNLVWLRVRNQATALSQTRVAITHGSTQLDNVADRQELEKALQQDPLASLITTILAIGLVMTLVLAFIGNLSGFWIYVRGQVVQLALLRALGLLPAQIRNLLLWELGMMQGVALVLGCVFGSILAITLTPALVFTTTSPSALQTPLAFYQLQTVLPVRVVIPPAVLLMLAALSAITLGTVAVSMFWLRRLAISQTLRFDDD